MEFSELVKVRHSAINFKEGHEIPEGILKAIYSMVQQGPSVYNLQPFHFLVVTDKNLKNLVYKMSFEQYKLHTASAIVFVLANKDFPAEAESIYAPMKMLGMMNEDDYGFMMKNIQQGFGLLGEDALKDEAVKNAMIAATSWMYASKDLGWDTCPMHVHNFDTLRDICGIPMKYEPVLMIAMGKSYDKERKRGFRKPYSQACTIDRFD